MNEAFTFVFMNIRARSHIDRTDELTAERDGVLPAFSTKCALCRLVASRWMSSCSHCLTVSSMSCVGVLRAMPTQPALFCRAR